MTKWFLKSWSYVIVVLVLLASTCFSRFWQMPWWVNTLMILLWVGMVKIKAKYAWIFLILLIALNLNLNRLLYFRFNPWSLSFDREQSFLDYPGIRTAIIRYGQEGLWIPYRLRNIFYSSYLVFFSYLTGVAKLLSPLFWVKILGFSGFGLFLLGIISYFKQGFKKYYVGTWFLIVILTSALRVLGDSVTAMYVAIPAVFIFLFKGTQNDFFKKYQVYWWLIFGLDLLLK